MQISRELPQFNQGKTCILVVSTQAADIYLAEDGAIESVASVRIEKPEYSDHEGHFEQRSRDGTASSGGVPADKAKTEKIKKDFRSNLTEAIAAMEVNDITQTILLSPSQDKQVIRKCLNDKLQQTLILELDGNYVGEHPDKILKRIQKAGS